MRRAARYVKPLALAGGIWHHAIMSKEADRKQAEKAERLREALRANLRRRKVGGGKPDVNSPKSVG